MSKSIKLKNDIYLDSDSVIGKSINQNDFFSYLNNGITLVHYNVFKISNSINGTIVLQTTNPIANVNQEIFNIKEKYRSKVSFYTFCGLGTADWRVQRIGYFYLGSNGNGIILDQNNFGDCKYAIINFNYQTN